MISKGRQSNLLFEVNSTTGISSDQVQIEADRTQIERRQIPKRLCTRSVFAPFLDLFPFDLYLLEYHTPMLSYARDRASIGCRRICSIKLTRGLAVFICQ